mgnify:CR=1 FL=1
MNRYGKVIKNQTVISNKREVTSIICRLFKGGNQIDLKTPLSFPLLAEGVVTGAIILFEDYYSGVILYIGVNKIDTKGKRHSSKVPITNTSVWRILEEGEQIVLSNSTSHKNPDNN